MSISAGNSKTVTGHTGVGSVKSQTLNPSTPLEYGREHLDTETFTVAQSSITEASPGVLTITGHGLETGEWLVYNTAGGTALVTGSGDTVADGAAFYVINATADTIKLASTYLNAIAGTGLQISTDGNDGSATSYADKAILLVGRGGGGAAGTTYGGVGVTTELFRVDMGGNVHVKDGDLKIGTAGHGIDFSATSDATGKDNELLDDYEEGNFTPILNFGGI